MIGEPCNDTIPAFDTYNSLHYADWNLGLVEVWALFNVQFEICGQSAGWNACISNVRGILPITAQPICQCQPLLVFPFENLRPERPSSNARTQRADPKMIALFVRPDDGFQRVPSFHASIVQSPHYLNRPHAAPVAIKVSAVQLRINIR